MYDVLAPRRSGMAMASAVALLISGCDAAGPGSNPQSAETGESPDSRLTYREGGVVLSKTASDELADFVTATQFDVVLPMSTRLNAMNPDARDRFHKQVAKARSEVDKAVRRVQDAGSEPSERDIRNLEAANRRFEHLFRKIMKDSERGRSRDRGKQLLEKYPFLRGRPADQVRDILRQAVRMSSKHSAEDNAWASSSVAGDTSEGVECRMDCGTTAAIGFGALELGFAGATWGCIASAAAFFPCFGIASAIKYYGLGMITWNLNTCTKKCG